jgi:heat shock protein HslJ
MGSAVKRYGYFLLGVLVLVLGACTPPAGPTPVPGDGETPAVSTPDVETPTASPEPPSPADPLTGTGWILESFGPVEAVEPVIAGTTVTLEFGGDHLAGGMGGCNAYETTYEVRGNRLSFGDITSTLIACEAVGVMDQESRYFQALQAAGEFELAGGRLQIGYDNGQGLLNFVRAGTQATQTPGPPAGVLCSDTTAASDPDWKMCRSLAFGFEVQYPPEGQLVDQSEQSARIDLPFTPGTNLAEKYLEITAAETGEACSSPFSAGYTPGTTPAEPVQLNDLEFIKETGQEGAAGSIYDWVAYSTGRDSLCVSLGFVLRAGNPDAYSTPPPLYDKVAESEVFEEIVKTFQWQETKP